MSAVSGFGETVFKSYKEENTMNTKTRLMSLMLMLTVSAGLMSGCGGSGKTADDANKTVITVGNCPDSEMDPAGYDAMMDKVERFEQEHPDVKIKTDTWTFDSQSYIAKAEGGTLPTVYYVPLTEANNIMNLGYAADITEEFKARGFYDNVNEFILDNISKDGKVYFLPSGCYDVGLAMNMDLMEQAGYVESDGTPVEPQTWQELAEMAVKVKEVTGKSGFIFPTTGNAGGWRFMPIAWSYGVEFMKQDESGKWIASFDTPECVEALQFVKDLKWKYDVLPANTLVDTKEIQKQMGTGECAMTFGEPTQISRYMTYGIQPNGIGVTRIPAGPKKKVSLMGGSYFVINVDSTPEQIKAAIDWREFDGDTMNLNESIKTNIAKDIETKKANNEIIGLQTLSPWKSDCEVNTYKADEYGKNSNVNMNHIKLYNDKNGIEYQAEEPIDAQALYALLDACIQEVLTNKDADCAALIHKAAADFQQNNLDYAK